MKVSLLEVWRDNTLLRDLDAGHFDLDPKLPDDYIPGFVEESDLVPGLERDFLVDYGFKFDAYVNFHPPHFAILGSDFWLVGRYIIARISEIDSAHHFVPEGFKINTFDSREEAKEAFGQIQATAPLIEKLTQDDES